MKNKNKAKGGKARAEALSPEERKAIAMKGVMARRRKQSLPKATHVGEIVINSVSLNVSVLENGIRVISDSSVFKALDRARRGYKRDDVFEGTNIPVPAFMDAKNLRPYVTQELVEYARKIEYVDQQGKISLGYNANILPALCDLYLSARANGIITTEAQAEVAKKAEILVRGLSRVGIVALVDEATGYQKDRAKNALAEILEKFVAKELQPWVKTFPSEYYEELFRIYGLPYPPENHNARPGFMGRITNNVIYSRLAPNLLDELKKAEKKSEKSGRLHQRLTPDVGHPKLREHLASIITLLKLSKNKDDFLELVDRIHPKYNDIIDISNSDS